MAAAAAERGGKLGLSRGTTGLDDVLDESSEVPDEQDSLVEKVVERSPKGRFLRFNQLLSKASGRRVYASYDTVDGTEVAWKEIDVRGISREDLATLQEELRILSELRHPHVVAFHNLWRVGMEKVVYITDLFTSGSLDAFIARARMIRWKAIKRWSRQTLRGLHYLHDRAEPIIHRNLNCASVYINGASGEIIIAEFGLSTHRAASLTQTVGTPGFMAPEQYEGKYDEKADIFAFGMMVLEMLTRAAPYAELNGDLEEIRRRVLAQVEPQGISRVSEGRARGFIRACLRGGDRPSAAELLTHPFLRKDADLDEEVVPVLPEELGEERSQPRMLGEIDRRSSGSNWVPVSGEDSDEDSAPTPWARR